MRYRSKPGHRLAPAQVWYRRPAPISAMGDSSVSTIVLFRCQDGCTDPESYRTITLAGRWTMTDLGAGDGCHCMTGSLTLDPEKAQAS